MNDGILFKAHNTLTTWSPHQLINRALNYEREKENSTQVVHITYKQAAVLMARAATEQAQSDTIGTRVYHFSGNLCM